MSDFCIADWVTDLISRTSVQLAPVEPVKQLWCQVRCGHYGQKHRGTDMYEPQKK